MRAAGRGRRWDDGPRPVSESRLVQRVRLLGVLAAIVWTAAAGGSLALHIRHESRHAADLARGAARQSITKDLLYRLWASRHGGVYVPADDGTPPSPFLADVSERDVATPTGRRLTLLNPAYMTRQVHTLAREEFGDRSHITSLRPINPINAPESWETAALRAFEVGAAEATLVETLGGETYVRVMRPFKVEASCLRCHAKQGYALGDIRGGISASVRLAPYLATSRAEAGFGAWGYGGLWLLGTLGIALAARNVEARVRERVVASAAREASEERYRAMFDLSPLPKFLYDPATLEILDVNDAAVREYGYGHEAFVAMRWSDLHDPDQFARLLAEHDGHASSHAHSGVWKHRRSDGSWIDVRLWCHGLELAARPLRLVVAEDVTERTRAEEEVQVSLRKLSEAQRLAHLGSWDLDLVRDVLTWSEEIYRIFEIDPAAFGASYGAFLAAVHPEDRDAVNSAYRKSVADHEPYDIVHRLLMSDGRVKYVNERCLTLYDADGRPARSVGTVQDITERKQAEQEKDQYLKFFLLSSDAMCIADPFGCFKQVNPALQQMTGYSEDELVSRPFLDFVVPEDRRRTADEMALQVSTRSSLNFENRYLRKDGTAVLLSWNAYFDKKDGITYATARDVTEHRRLEEQLRHAQKMEAVGRLAGGVAHDFNDVLQALLSHTQLMRALGQESARLQAAVGEMEDQIRRGAALTRQLLLFSRREAAKREALDVNEVVQGAVRMLRRLVRENVSFELDLTEAALPVEADRGQLDQVLLNLVVNASDAMPAGGTLTIRTWATEAEWAWIEVEDTGHGILEEIRDRIFEPFFTTKDAGKGTGLGLSVVHGIVTQHSGRVEVESRVGEGTAFRIGFPRAGALAPPAVAEDEPAAPPPRGAGERILVVEDEPSTRESLREIVTTLGYEVAAAGSGEEARALETGPPFNLLLTDLMLPGVSGPELAGELATRWPGLKVILMSGYTEDEAIRQGISRGHVRFLQKPFDIPALAQEIRAALAES